MKHTFSIFYSKQWYVLFLLNLVGICTACASMPTPVPTLFPTPFAVVITPRPQPSPSPTMPPIQIPEIPGLEARPEFSGLENLEAVQYYNSADVAVAQFDPKDPAHNQHISWNWAAMTALEKTQTVAWLFDPHQMHYCRFQNREGWVINALTKWIPRLNTITVPTDPAIAVHWPADGPPMNHNTLYEALSRVKSLALVPERPTCSYGFSHLGLIEYGGEVILFSAPGWQKVSVETREILTTAWTIKEAMVIYYPQSQGWASSCPAEPEHLKNEYYSTIWLVAAEQALARVSPSDRSYWENQEIPFQSKHILTQTFPPCSPPIILPGPTPDPSCPQLP
jgi:hypothetical protein